MDFYKTDELIDTMTFEVNDEKKDEHLEQNNSSNTPNGTTLEKVKIALKENFPTKYMYIHCSVIMVLSICTFGIQIVLLMQNSYLAKISNGIWCALLNWIAVVVALILCNFCLHFST